MGRVLEGHIDDIVELILEGKTFREIASKKGVALGTLHSFITLDEHSVRVRNALEVSASSYADKAEEVLILAEKDSIEMTRARELAQHYRWKAGKRNPKKYGDKLDLTTKGDSLSKSEDLSSLSNDELIVYSKLKEKIKPNDR